MKQRDEETDDGSGQVSLARLIHGVVCRHGQDGIQDGRPKSFGSVHARDGRKEIKRRLT
jgi:hypothetical protein